MKVLYIYSVNENSACTTAEKQFCISWTFWKYDKPYTNCVFRFIVQVFPKVLSLFHRVMCPDYNPKHWVTLKRSITPNKISPVLSTWSQEYLISILIPLSLQNKNPWSMDNPLNNNPPPLPAKIKLCGLE